MNYYSQGSKISIFSERELTEHLRERGRQLQTEVESEAENYLLNVNETEYVNHLVDKYSVDNLSIYPDRKSVKPYDKEIRAERFPPSFSVRPGRSYKKTVIKYFLPFEGDQALLYCCPNPSIPCSTEVLIEDGHICFEVVDFHGDAGEIKKKADNFIRPIMRQLGNVQKQVNGFNSSLEQRARSAFQQRKKQLLEKNDLVAQLSVPVRKRSNVPETFSITPPKMRAKIQIRKPEVHEKGFQPEPSLDRKIYLAILRTVHDVGREFERVPSTYVGKGEEELRDHFLLMLEPNFEGSATGETFNNNGKTDILLRHDGANVFIAECKFWSGKKALLATIDQLLGYLTWRDSKAAIILFVSNKSFTNVLDQIDSVAKSHPNYLGASDKTDASWFNFRFHLPEDPNREVQTAIMLYHLPEHD